MTITPLELAIAAVLFLVKGLVFGLYLGERGRRIDAQRIAKVDKPGRADVQLEPTEEEAAAARIRPLELETLAQRIAEQEGISMKKARQAADEILRDSESWAEPDPSVPG